MDEFYDHKIISLSRPHRSTMYVDAACSYRCSMVCQSVCLSRSWALQKQLNRSRWPFGFGLGWAHVLDGV